MSARAFCRKAQYVRLTPSPVKTSQRSMRNINTQINMSFGTVAHSSVRYIRVLKVQDFLSRGEGTEAARRTYTEAPLWEHTHRDKVIANQVNETAREDSSTQLIVH